MTQPGGFSDEQVAQLKGIFDAYFGEIKNGLTGLAREAIQDQLGPAFVEAAQKPPQVVEGQAHIVNGHSETPPTEPAQSGSEQPAKSGAADSDFPAALQAAMPLLTALVPLVQTLLAKPATPDVGGMMNQVAAFNQTVSNAFVGPIMEYVRYGASLGANAFGAAVKATGQVPDPTQYAKNIAEMDVPFAKPPAPADPAPALTANPLPGNANRAAKLAQL